MRPTISWVLSVRFLFLGVVTIGLFGVAALPYDAPSVPRDPSPPPDEASEDWLARAARQIAFSEYEISRHEATSLKDLADWRLSVVGSGRGRVLWPVLRTTPTPEANRVDYQRGGVIE